MNENKIRNKFDRAVIFEKRYLYAKNKYGVKSDELVKCFVEFYARTYALILCADVDINLLRIIREKIVFYKDLWKFNNCIRIQNRILCRLILLRANGIIKIISKNFIS